MQLKINTSSIYCQLFIAILIVLWTVTLYYKGLYGPFLLDDVLIFPSTQLMNFSYESVMQVLTAHNSGLFGRPISIFSFIINHQLMGPDPSGYKMVNLGIHLANTFLIFLIAKSLLTHLKDSSALYFTLSPGSYAFFISLIWAIHPLQVSTVLYVFQRMMLLSTLFIFLAVLSYIYGRMGSGKKTRKTLFLFILFPIFAISALASKENGALIIGYITVIEIFIFGFNTNSKYESVLLRFFYTIFLLIPGVLAIYFFISHTDVILEGYGNRSFNLVERIMTETVAIMYYLRLIVAPNLNEMSLYHDAFNIKTALSPSVIASITCIIGLAITTYILQKKQPLLALGICIFFIGHMLESTIIPLELVFEHRNYLALLGVVLIAISLLNIVTQTKFFPNKTNRNISVGACILLTLALSSFTFSRTAEWSDELTMNALAVKNKPDSFRAHVSLMTTLANKNRYEDALAVLQTTIQKNPERPVLGLLNISLNCLSGNFNSIQVLDSKSQLKDHTLSENVAPAFSTLFDIKHKGHCENLELEQLADLLETAANNPKKRMPNISRSNLYMNNAKVQSEIGNYLSAIEYLEKAHFYSPNEAILLIKLAQFQLIENKFAAAEKTIENLEALNNNHFNAYELNLINLKTNLVEKTRLSSSEQ